MSDIQDSGGYVQAVATKLTNNNKGARRGSKNSESGEAWKCEECGKIFKSEKDKVLECEYCEQHYCIRCLKFKAGEYEAMRKPGCMWFCIGCKPKIEKNILNEKIIQERCELYLETINARLETLETKLQDKCDEQEVKEIVRKELIANQQTENAIHTDTTDRVNNEVLQDAVKEIAERKSR